MMQRKGRVKGMKINAGMIIAAVVMIPVIIIVSALSVDYAVENGGKIFFSFGGKASIRNTIEIPLSDIDSLQVKYSSKNIYVYPAEGDAVIVKEYLINDGEEALAEVEINDGKAVVAGGKTITFTILGIFAGTERIEVYIPVEGLSQLGVQTTSGNIHLEQVSGDTVIQASSGNIKIEEAEGSLTVKAGSGNISVKGLTGQAAIEVGSGNIKVDKMSGRIKAEAGSGNITVREFAGQGSLKAGSGSVKAEAAQITGDLEVKTGSGSIHLILPQELSFEAQIQTGSGNISTAFDSALSYNKKGNQASGTVGGNPSCLVSAEANSGNVRITTE